MASVTLLWITTVIMLLGGLAILLTGKRRTRTEEFNTVCHGIVPLIAGCSYFAMATHQGSVPLPIHPGADTMRTFYWSRYTDWVFTTPLLLLTLSFTAMHNGPKRYGALTGVVLADVMMIITAFAFGASLSQGPKWTWFIISCVAFLGVYYVLWVSNMQANAAERDDVRSTYRRHASFLSIVWFIYPIALALSPDGLRILSDAGGVLFIAILDVIAKVVYGFMAVIADTKATNLDLSEPIRRPVATTETRVPVAATA